MLNIIRNHICWFFLYTYKYRAKVTIFNILESQSKDHSSLSFINPDICTNFITSKKVDNLLFKLINTSRRDKQTCEFYFYPSIFMNATLYAK